MNDSKQSARVQGVFPVDDDDVDDVVEEVDFSEVEAVAVFREEEEDEEAEMAPFGGWFRGSEGGRAASTTAAVAGEAAIPSLVDDLEEGTSTTSPPFLSAVTSPFKEGVTLRDDKGEEEEVGVAVPPPILSSDA